MSNYQTVLVAYCVKADSIDEASDWLYDNDYLPRKDQGWMDEPDHTLDQWWIADDSNPLVAGGSESAVFIPNDMTQAAADALIRRVGNSRMAAFITRFIEEQYELLDWFCERCIERKDRDEGDFCDEHDGVCRECCDCEEED